MMALVASAAAANAAALTYTTGLDVWLDASDIDGSNNSTLTDGASFATWTNKGTTGVGNAIAPTTGSLGNTEGVLSASGGDGGQASVTLDNTRYHFAGGEWGDSSNVTMYFVLNQSTGSSANASILTDYGTVGAELRNLRVGGGSAGAYLRDSDNDALAVAHGAGDLADQSWATVFFSFDATTGTSTWGELGSTTTGTNAAYNTSTTFEGTFGGPVTLFGFHDGNNTHDFNGSVSEVLIYDHLLDAGQRAQVESYIVSKTIPEPCSAALLGVSGLAFILRRRRK